MPHRAAALVLADIHALMSVLSMQAVAVVRAEAGDVERIREIARRVG